MLTNVQPTSIAAFHKKRDSGRTTEQRAYIVDFIAYVGGDWSIGELANRFKTFGDACKLGLDQKSTLSARINECLNETRELVAKDRRKDRVSHVLVRPVALPPEHGALF